MYIEDLIAAALDRFLLFLPIVVLLYCLTISPHRLLEILPCPRGSFGLCWSDARITGPKIHENID